MNQEQRIEADDPAVAVRDDITLRHVIMYFWRGRKTIAVTTGILVLIALLYIHIATPLYQATLIIAPAPGMSSSSASSAISSAASLLGVSGVPTSPTTDYDKFLSLLVSESLAEELVKQHKNLLSKVFYKQWDPAANKWREPSGPIAWIVAAFKAFVGLPPYTDPNATLLATWITGNVSIATDPTTQLTTLTVELPDKTYTRDFLILLHRDADNILRQTAQKTTNKQIQYLEKVLPTITETDLAAAMIQTFARTEQTAMMVSVNPNYAADIVNPSSVTEFPAWPNAVLLLGGAIAAGLMIGSFLFLLFDALEFAPSFPRLRNLKGAFVLALRRVEAMVRN